MIITKARRARTLRNTMTRSEVKLWIELKTWRAKGYQFRRQAPFRGYYLDFVCFNYRLAIELDGDVHLTEAQAEHDRVRDAVIRRAGFRLLRFWNAELDADFEAVLERIAEALEQQTPTRQGALRPDALPMKGRDG